MIRLLIVPVYIFLTNTIEGLSLFLQEMYALQRSIIVEE